MQVATPAQLEDAWYVELERLQDEPVQRRELQKIRNQVIADAVRGMQSNFTLMLQLGFYEALGGWEHINDVPQRLKAVTPADVQRVARQYFEPENRSVATYQRLSDAEAEPMDEELLALDPGFRAQAVTLLVQMQGYSLPVLRQVRARLPAESPSDDPEQIERYQAFRRYILGKIDERIAMLEAKEDEP